MNFLPTWWVFPPQSIESLICRKKNCYNRIHRSCISLYNIFSFTVILGNIYHPASMKEQQKIRQGLHIKAKLATMQNLVRPSKMVSNVVGIIFIWRQCIFKKKNNASFLGGKSFSAIQSKSCNNASSAAATMLNESVELPLEIGQRGSLMRNKYFHKDWGNQNWCFEKSCSDFLLDFLESFQIPN